MHYHRALLQYDGTDYAGFQWQEDAPTIQSELNQALSRMLSGKISTLGASRTDAGVHAWGQVVKLTTEVSFDGASLCERLNRELPAQIRCLSLVPCAGDFNPPVDAQEKEYSYFFTNAPRPGNVRFVANITNPLRLDLIHQCVSMLPGSHDFQNFCSTGSNVKTTRREVLRCTLSEVIPHTVIPFSMAPGAAPCWELQIVSRGFLKQMIRHLVRGLWMVGSGRISVDEFHELLVGPKRPGQLWRVAPASGLHLREVSFATWGE